MYGWARSLKSLIVYPTGLIAETRFKNLHYPWQEIETVVVAFDGDTENPHLSLVVTKKDPNFPALIVDLSETSSSVRAKQHLIRDVSTYAPQLRYVPMATLNFGERVKKSY
jgi:hypothetical protein